MTHSFQKQFQSSEDLVNLLQSRGLQINDATKASKYLDNIGYYRLSAYMHPLLIFNEIEKIEIAVRRAVMQIPAEIFNNPFWLTNSEYFLNLSNFRDTMQIIASEYDKSKEEFIQHFKRTYSESFPPSWSNIKYNSVRKRIAKQFQLPIDVFESWLTIIAVTRNACCHHARVWNKQNAIAPTIPNHLPRP